MEEGSRGGEGAKRGGQRGRDIIYQGTTSICRAKSQLNVSVLSSTERVPHRLQAFQRVVLPLSIQTPQTQSPSENKVGSVFFRGSRLVAEVQDLITGKILGEQAQDLFLLPCV